MIDTHLREKFATGLTNLPHSKQLRLDRIIGYHYSAIGQAHAPSIVDIVLGSFRFSINAVMTGDEGKIPTARKLLSLVAPLFRLPDGFICDLCLHLSPREIHVAKYADKYKRLHGFLSEHGIE